MSVYFPHTSEDIRKMLEVVGKSSLDALFDDLPASLRLQRPLRLEPGMTEHKLTRRLTSLAERNTPVGQLACFLGAGAYDHIVPAAVDALASRQEFFTAYTPYQPEISQGTLQALFEYQ
ncbi:MAG TPA: glycine dehydrogenase, partial [Clostridia bacterium]